MSKRSRVTIGELRDAVIRLYLRDGKDHDLAEIAEEVGCSRGTAQRRITEEGGGTIPGCTGRMDRRTSYSRNYRGFETGTHSTWVYGPTRATLRDMLLSSEKAREKIE